jgi:hypothetical protein
LQTLLAVVAVKAETAILLQPQQQIQDYMVLAVLVAIAVLLLVLAVLAHKVLSLLFIRQAVRQYQTVTFS